MPTANGRVVILVLLLTFTLNFLFGILIARATYRAMTNGNSDQFLRIVFLNDSLERIRSAILGEVISWGAI